MSFQSLKTTSVSQTPRMNPAAGNCQSNYYSRSPKRLAIHQTFREARNVIIIIIITLKYNRDWQPSGFVSTGPFRFPERPQSFSSSKQSDQPERWREHIRFCFRLFWRVIYLFICITSWIIHGGVHNLPERAQRFTQACLSDFYLVAYSIIV